MRAAKTSVKSVSIQRSAPIARRTAHTNSARATATTLPQKDTLLLMATDRFCGRSSHDRLTVEHYKEAFYALCGEVERDTLAQVATLLKSEPFTPREILMYLALEPIKIADGIIREASTLSQLDLVRICANKGLNHAVAVANRSDLGPSLVRHLRSLNDGEINKALKANSALLDNVSQRSVERIFETINSEDRQIFSDAAWQKTATPAVKSESKAKSKQLESTNSDRAQNTLLQAAARGGRIKVAPVQKVEEQTTELSTVEFADALEKAVLKRSRQGMAALIQKQYGLSFDTATQVMDDKSGRTLGVLMKSADIDAAKANRIMLLTFPAIGLSVANTRECIRFYNNLQQTTSQQAVAQWPKAPVAPPAYQPSVSDAPGNHRPVARNITVHQELGKAAVNY